MRKSLGPWLRLYSRIVNDRKVQSLPGEMFKRWISLLCIAKENDGTLPEMEDIAFKLRCGIKEAQSIISFLIDKKLLTQTESGITPHDWSDWQYDSDVSTERVRRFRKQSETVSETAMKRCETVSETPRARDRTEQSRTEQNGSISPAVEFSADDAENTTRRIYHRHPKHRRGSLKLAMDAITELLTDSVNPNSLLAKLDRHHQAACESRGWMKDGGEFVPGLVKWIQSEEWDTDDIPTAPEKSQYRTVEEMRAAIRGEA